MATNLSLTVLLDMRTSARDAQRAGMNLDSGTFTPTLLIDMIQYIHSLRSLAITRGKGGRDSGMWFNDGGGNKVSVAHLGICEECSEVYCGCDADEDGFYLCPNHRVHPIINGKVVCVVTNLFSMTPKSREDIFELMCDHDVWTEAEVLAIYAEISTWTNKNNPDSSPKINI